MKYSKNRPFEVGTILDDFINNLWDSSLSDLASAFKHNDPAINVIEEDDQYRVELAAPGLQKSDFNLKVEDGFIQIKVEKETEGEGTKFSRQEFNYTNFKRSFKIPESVNLTKIDAIYENGLLVIRLPKLEEAKEPASQTIEIK